MCDVSFSRDDYQCALDTYASEKKGKHALVELDRYVKTNVECMYSSAASHLFDSPESSDTYVCRRWYRSELRNALQSRHPKYITREELVKVVRCPTILAVLHRVDSFNIDCNQHTIHTQHIIQVKWKLTRGTWRPKLVSYAEKHAASTIIDVSSAAFEFAGAISTHIFSYLRIILLTHFFSAARMRYIRPKTQHQCCAVPMLKGLYFQMMIECNKPWKN